MIARMPRVFPKRLLAAAALSAAGCASLGKAPPAELVLTGGSVYTLAEPRKVEALAVRGGRVVFAGDAAGAARRIGAGTSVVELAGRAVLPGFHDCHTHPAAGGVELGECDLNHAALADMPGRLRRCAEEAPEGWLRGGGWALTLFGEPGPHKSVLDAAVPDRPAYFTAADGHSAWVNSKALELAGITRDTVDPEDGRIEREPGTGEPTGTLREGAMELVGKLLPPYAPEQAQAGLKRGLHLAARLGITTFYEAAAEPWMLEAYEALDRAGSLTARVNVSVALAPAKGAAQAAEIAALRERLASPRLRVLGGKAFADGVLEARTAALLEPYADKGGLGGANWEPGVLADAAAALEERGLSLHVHAIGDRAVRMALDAFAEARRRNGPGDRRHQIAHLELIDPADLPRFRELGVTACFQPLWAQADEYITKLTEPGLGPERSRRLYPLASAARAGARLACGSDWSVSSMSPLEGMQVGATRRGIDAGPGPAWLPEERLSAAELARCYTSGGAYAVRQEALTGTLEPGKAADLVVLDQDPFLALPEELGAIGVHSTYLDGRLIYLRDQETRNQPRP